MKFEVQYGKLNEARYYVCDAIESIERCYRILCDACDSNIFENGKLRNVENHLMDLMYETRIEKRECALLETSLNGIIDIYANIEKNINEVKKCESTDLEDEKERIISELLEEVMAFPKSIQERIEQKLINIINKMSEKQLVDWLDLLSNNKDNKYKKVLKIILAESSLDGWDGDLTNEMNNIIQYVNNTIQWQDLLSNSGNQVISQDGYIEFQGELTGLKYGNGIDIFNDSLFGGELTGADNLCEVIAVYNALISLDEEKTNIQFPDLIYDFSNDGIVLNGCFGTSPIAMKEYLDELGYETGIIVGEEIDSKSIYEYEEKFDTYILTAYNKAGHIESQIHTVSITYEEVSGKYYIHNDNEYDSSTGTYNKDYMYGYDSLEDAINGFNSGTGGPISLIGVSK